MAGALAARKGGAGRLLLIGIIATVLVTGVAALVLNRFKNSSFDSDPYVKANDFYKRGLVDYQNGDARAAAEKFAKAVDSQTMEKGQGGGREVYPNLVTHNAAGFLAILSASNGDCDEYWKYRALMESIAKKDWYYVMQGERVEQKNDTEKQKAVSEAAAKVQGSEHFCNGDGLPVRGFGQGAGEKTK